MVGRLHKPLQPRSKCAVQTKFSKRPSLLPRPTSTSVLQDTGKAREVRASSNTCIGVLASYAALCSQFPDRQCSKGSQRRRVQSEFSIVCTREVGVLSRCGAFGSDGAVCPDQSLFDVQGLGIES